MTQKQNKLPPVHHAEEFGLDVTSGDNDLFRWFLLCFLFGKPIQATVAVQAWQVFVNKGIDTPWAIDTMPQRQLMRVLNEGHYSHYSESTSKGMKRCMAQLINNYEGSLMLMYESSQDEEEFSKRLQELHGIGPKTAAIFMTETEELFARRVE